MHRRIVTSLALAVLLLIFTQPCQAAKKKQTFEQLSHEILETLQSFYPVKATEMGIHSYDHRLADYSPRSVKSMVRKLNDYRKRLNKYRNADFSPSQQVDYRLITSNVETALQDLNEIAWHRKSPQLYIDEATNGIYFLMVSRHAPLSEKLYSLLARMRAVPSLLTTATRNIKSPPKLWIDQSLESLESAMQLYREVASELMNEFPERADEILKVSTQAREAMNDFLHHLEEMPVEPDAGFAIGSENYNAKLRYEYFLPYDSDSLLKIGEALLEKAQAAYMEYEGYVETYHQNGQDSVFVPANFTRQDILDYYTWEVNQVSLFLKAHNILSIPDTIAPLSIVQTPPFLRSVIPGLAYQPAGPFDSNQQGYLYVRPIPDDLDRGQLEALYHYVHRRGFRALVVQKAFPGNHLQMQIAAHHPSEVRRWQRNGMMIEGWSLFCDEMMYRAGLYGEENPAMWLTILGEIRLQAARMVADVKLHTGQFTYEECVDWMGDVLGAATKAERQYIGKSVHRCTLAPTTWISPLMGKHEIERLRAATKTRDDVDFNEARFYDALLAEGSIPLTLMWEILGLQPLVD